MKTSGSSFEKDDAFVDSPTGSYQTEFDPVRDRTITRKLDYHLLPWLFGIWFFAFIDRSNIGNARISGLSDDLGLDGNKFNVVLLVFYVSVIILTP